MRLIDEAQGLLDRLESEGPPEAVPTVRAARKRLDEPLRVAIAGRVKAGKSTMLNAVIGHPAAATDSAECTRAVTWYVDGVAYLAWVQDRDGQRRQVPYRRSSTAAVVDLSNEDLGEIERVEVEFPSPRLQAMTLIDTPGIASVSEQVSARAADFLTPEHGDQGADVVLYMLRHVHERDADFLEAFTDRAVATVGVARSVAVLSRADEVGNGRGDSLEIARLVARRYAAHPVLREKVADVLPVAGLLAFAASTLTEDEFGQLRQLAGLTQTELEMLVVSVDRLLTRSPDLPVSVEARNALLDRLGLFGIRLATASIRSGRSASAGSLARALEADSGIGPLRTLLLDRFASRADVLKAARAIDLVHTIVARMPAGDSPLRRELERVTAASHELAELRCLAFALAIPTEQVRLEEATRRNAYAALGSDGSEVWQRLRVDPAADQPEMVAVALQRVQEFRNATLASLIDERTAEILQVALRSVEAVHFQLTQQTAAADLP